MTLPVIAGVTRVTYRGSLISGQQWANVMHFQYAGGASSPGTAEYTALHNKVLRLYSGTAYTTGTPWFNFCTPDTKLIDATFYNLDGTSAPHLIPLSNIGSGTSATNTPQECAVVITLRTGHRGRRYRGRIYLPAPYAAAITGTSGNLTSAIVGTVLVQARGLLADLPSAQWAWGVASYGKGTLNNVPTTWPPFFTPITDVTMDGVLDVQRRRKQ